MPWSRLLSVATGLSTKGRRSRRHLPAQPIYEELHPETKAGVAGDLARQGSASEKSAFAEAASDATGKSRRSVEIAAARGEALGDDLREAAGSSIGVTRSIISRGA
jgi:hypothetical protein